MSVLINVESGLAEDLQSQELAQQALQAGTHHIPLNDPEGNPVTASMEEAQGLMAQGYQQPDPSQLKSLLTYAKHSTPAEQAKAFAEGAAEAATFGVSAGVERALGVDPEAMLARREIFPGTRGVGQAVGLVGSALVPGPGAAKALTGAGRLAAEALGVGRAGTGLVSRATATGVKQAVEMALFQGGDEVAKALVSDPEQSVGTAITDIGLASLLGGTVGGIGHLAAEPLWLAAKGSGVAKAIESLRSKALNEGLAPGASPASLDLLAKAEQAGVQVPPSIRAVLVGDDAARASGAGLRESSTKAGMRYQSDLKAFEQSAKERVLSAIGKTDDDLLAGVSDFERGAQARDSLLKELKERITPITEKFEPIREKFKSAVLPEGTQAQLAEDLGQLAVKEGYSLSETSPALSEINRAIKDLKNIKTLEDLRKYQSIARANAGDIASFRLGKQMVSILRDAEENALGRVMGVEAPGLVAEHAAARQGYKEVMNTLDDLNDRLHVGKYWGPDSFLKNLKEMTPEDVLRRLKGSSDAGLLTTLSEKFPGTAQAVREHHIDQFLSKVSSQGELDTRKFFKAMDKMSPELKAFALPAEAEGQLTAIKDILQQLPERLNPSGTAKALDRIMGSVPGGIGSIISLATGNNPLVGYALGHLSKELGREAPDAAKLAFLRMLGSDAPASAGGYKALFKYVEAAYRGAQTIDRASKAVFKPGAEVLGASLLPTEKQQNTITKAVKAAQVSPESLMNVTGDTGHYLPEHATELSSAAARTVQYLNSLRPNTDPSGVLDGDRVPNSFEQARYMRAVSIAQQPLLPLKFIKEGTLLPQDIADLSAMHPGLYKHLQLKMMTELSEAKEKGALIPYKTRLGLSMFMQQPLDASMMPQNIAANQAVGGAQAPEQGQAPQPNKADLKGLDGIAQGAQTALQARTRRKSG